MLIEENTRAGMAPKEAQRAARIELGGSEQVKEQVREVRMGNWLHSVAPIAAMALDNSGRTLGLPGCYCDPSQTPGSEKSITPVGVLCSILDPGEPERIGFLLDPLRVLVEAVPVQYQFGRPALATCGLR